MSQKYQASVFSDLANEEFGKQLWRTLNEPKNVVRMETATFLRRPAVEPLGPILANSFGADVADDRTKQMIGHMVRQIMENQDYEIDRQGVRITRPNVFSTGTRYRKVGEKQYDSITGRRGQMEITREQREAWLEQTSKSPFNLWMDKNTKNPDGSLDLVALYKLAERYGIKTRYDYLNPGQQRMNIGNRLRGVVDDNVYSHLQD